MSSKSKPEPCLIIGRVRPRDLPPGSALAIAAVQANALAFQMEHRDVAEPIYVVVEPTAVRARVLIAGEERSVELGGNNSGDIFRAVDALVEEARPC